MATMDPVGARHSYLLYGTTAARFPKGRRLRHRRCGSSLSSFDAPDSARLHVAVSRLRRFLRTEETESGLRLVREADGYRLHAESETLDRVAFESWAERALTGDPAGCRASRRSLSSICPA